MKYQQLILEQFKKCELSPREGQLETINQIIEANVDRGIKFILLNAPTGSGKSIIGMISSYCIHELIGKNKDVIVDYTDVKQRLIKEKEAELDWKEKKGKDVSLERLQIEADIDKEIKEKYVQSYKQGPVLAVTSTKILQDQYQQQLEKSNQYFVNFKGKTNYSCNLKPMMKITAENCYKGTPFYWKEIEENEQVKAEYEETCSQCQFNWIKIHKNSCDFLLTNYSRYFIDALYVRTHGYGWHKRTVTVCDEAHLMNDNFVSHYTIYFAKDRYDMIMKDIKADFGYDRWQWIEKDLNFIMKGIQNKYISKNNYTLYTDILYSNYKKISDYYTRLSKWSINNQGQYFKFKSMADKYFCLGCNIDDFNKYKNDYILDMNYQTGVFQVKPLFISGLFKEKINISDCVIMMSATLTEEIIKTQFKFETNEAVFITAKNTFNQSDKQIIISKDLIKLKFDNCYLDQTNQILAKSIKKILNTHKGQSGIILVNSFKHAVVLNKWLLDNKSHKIIMHKQGQPISDHLNEFINTKEASILLSPSIFEGIDLYGDRSKFNILAKAPFPSLGDKRMFYISRKHQRMYKLMTLEKMIQGMGRSTRYKGDQSVSYLLDQNLIKLLNHKSNIWKDQFQIINEI